MSIRLTHKVCETLQASDSQASKTWSDGDPSRDPSMMGVASHAPSNHLGRYAMYDLDGDGHVTMDEIVTATFKNLFPDSFQSVLEVRNHKVSRGTWCMLCTLCPASLRANQI